MKYLKPKEDPRMETLRQKLMRKEVKAGEQKVGEQNALKILVDIFDWLYGLEPQPIWRFVSLDQES